MVKRAAPDGFRRAENLSESPSTPSSLGRYWRRAYHTSLLVRVHTAYIYRMRDERAVRIAGDKILFHEVIARVIARLISRGRVELLPRGETFSSNFLQLRRVSCTVRE